MPGQVEQVGQLFDGDMAQRGEKHKYFTGIRV